MLICTFFVLLFLLQPVDVTSVRLRSENKIRIQCAIVPHLSFVTITMYYSDLLFRTAPGWYWPVDIFIIFPWSTCRPSHSQSSPAMRACTRLFTGRVNEPTKTDDSLRHFVVGWVTRSHLYAIRQKCGTFSSGERQKWGKRTLNETSGAV